MRRPPRQRRQGRRRRGAASWFVRARRCYGYRRRGMEMRLSVNNHVADKNCNLKDGIYVSRQLSATFTFNGIQGPSTVTESDPPLQHQVVTRVEVHSWSACIVLYCRRSAEILLFCCYTRSGVIMLQVDMAKPGENYPTSRLCSLLSADMTCIRN